ncbi:MAG: D-alanine--D-alanine ligase, partial [Sphaerochaetaceae bacterium]|nr:D-alanine--D-alanine ligase [Sphaerochaetaceae bacterium]
GVMEILVDPKSDQGVYSYATKQNYLDCTRYQLVEGEVAQECAETALGAWRALDCRDGGRVDLRMDSNGIINFLEVNPLAGLHPVDSDLPILARLSGVSYKELLKRIMDSACQRVGLSQ